MKYEQALGYAWGRKDGPNTPTLDLVTDSGAFASWYSLLEERLGIHVTMQVAYNRFRTLSAVAQKRRGDESMRMAWSPYDDTHAR
jgi:hypothetical protein